MHRTDTPGMNTQSPHTYRFVVNGKAWDATMPRELSDDELQRIQDFGFAGNATTMEEVQKVLGAALKMLDIQNAIRGVAPAK